MGQSSSTKTGSSSPPSEKENLSGVQRRPTAIKNRSVFDQEEEFPWAEDIAAVLRGVAAATRKLVIGKAAAAKAAAAKGAAAKGAAAKGAAAKGAAAKGAGAKGAIQSVGDTRPLAFASEGAVAGESILPRVIYYGAWTLSGVAITADIFTKQDQAPPDKRWQTVFYWSAFHIPASLVIPAMIIHQIVHQVQHVVDNPKGFAKTWSTRNRQVAPVAAALISIIPVVPLVDSAAERIMEPTLGAYLGLEFHHHHHLYPGNEDPKEKTE